MDRTSKDYTEKNTLEFKDAHHIYYLNGARIDSVTTLIKNGMPTPEALMNWKIRNGIAGKKKAQELASIGTITHKYAESKVKEKPFDMEIINSSPDRDKILNCIELFNRFHSLRTGKVLLTEAMCASVPLLYAGTIDVISEDNMGRGIEDHKTSSGFFLEHFLQMAAYALLCFDWLNKDIHWLQVNLFGKTTPDFHTLRLHFSEGWFLDGININSDGSWFEALKQQFKHCIQTVKLVKEGEEFFGKKVRGLLVNG